MLRRKIYDKLLVWKNNKGKKDAILLRGVRQCGKTYIVREFGKREYKNFIEINFIERPDMQAVFSGNLDVDNMVQQIKLSMPGCQFIPGETLLFLDEIQDVPNARTSLKFWTQDGRFDCIASGSLLGMDYKNEVSIPVGYEQQLIMRTLDFEEFIWALGAEVNLKEMLAPYVDGAKRVPEAMHNSLNKYLQEYMVVGGLPEVVDTYIATKDFYQVHLLQEKILRDYQDDIAKYALNQDKIKAKQCFLSIPRQLSKENHKFQYSVVEKKATARKFTSSLDWLHNAGLIDFAYNVNSPWFPLKAYVKEDQFRVYLCDIGLLVAMYGYQLKIALLSDALEGPAKGGIYESLVADILAKRGEELYYYKKEDSTLEIEFILERDCKLVPVEVKARKGSTRSLNELLKMDNIEIGYKLTAQNTGVVEKKITLPLYMAAII
ncbi:MAG: AAA family ATPase [Phascolarctobacterium succinatutens]|uniref:ATP-binding protein n=1 Tax=Phascolarctobacterium succinatutens TaxID=626940 RepID=UPI0023F02114|nr:AAA family ATPase [Phascolarctobacterium succinatutens]MCI6543974.1 AAA family ATPase [Phascolarctobacterium succinatutens]